MIKNIRVKFKEDNTTFNLEEENTSLKTRLNLNDLLKRRKQEKKKENRYNTLVLFGCAIFAILVFIMLSI